MAKKIVERIERVCVLEDCPRKGKPMTIILYEDGTYRGGHYFRMGDEWEKEHGEYWECPACYRNYYGKYKQTIFANKPTPQTT